MNFSTPPSSTAPAAEEHTFGRDHFSPPPLAHEQAAQSMQAPSATEDEWDLVHRIRNVGEW